MRAQMAHFQAKIGVFGTLDHQKLIYLTSSVYGGGLTQKCRTCMGWGGCFRDPKHKSNMYTFVQQRGGVHILSRITKV